MPAELPPLTAATVKFVNNLDAISDFCAWVAQEHDYVAFDTETTGLDQFGYKEGRVRLAQFGDGVLGWAIPFDDHKWLIQHAFDRLRCPLLMHNAPFDVHFMATEKFVIRQTVIDTFLLSRVADPGSYQHGLKEQATKYVHPVAASGQARLAALMAEKGYTWADIPLRTQEYWFYGGLDCILTYRLFWVLKARAIALNVWHIAELEFAVQPVIIGMERAGLLVDNEYCNKQVAELTAPINELSAYCKHNFDIEPSKNKSVAIGLSSLGYIIEHDPKTGNPIVDKVALGLIDHPLAKAVIGYRNYSRLRNTYFKRMLDNQGPDGRVRAQILQCEARTGRMSVRGAVALQTIPRGPIVRNGFIAAPGYQMVTCDYAQIELRCVAHAANMVGLIDEILTGKDLHSENARLAFRLHDITKDMRQAAKIAVFTIVYGGGPPVIASQIGIPLSVAEDMYNMYMTKYPELPAFMAQRKAESSKYNKQVGAYCIKNMHGRICTIAASDLGDPRVHSGTNLAIQSACADLLKYTLIDLHAAGLGEYMRMAVHDECIFEVPKNLTKDVAMAAQAVMSDNLRWRVPILAEPSNAAQSWGGCK